MESANYEKKKPQCMNFKILLHQIQLSFYFFSAAMDIFQCPHIV